MGRTMSLEQWKLSDCWPDEDLASGEFLSYGFCKWKSAALYDAAYHWTSLDKILKRLTTTEAFGSQKRLSAISFIAFDQSKLFNSIK